MRRWARAEWIAIACAASLWGGCAAKGRASVKSSDAPPAEENAPAWEGSTGSVASTPSAPASGAVAAPPASASATAPPATPRPGCGLVCNVANKGRVAAADEARLTSGLAEITNALHECVSGRSPSMTLRFDSGGVLTGFGVDHAADDEGGGGAACVDSINRRMPAVSYPGPATVRCAERCAR